METPPSSPTPTTSSRDMSQTLYDYFVEMNGSTLIEGVENNICPECNTKMTIGIDADEYSCENCGNILINAGSSHGSITNNSDILRYQTEGRIKYHASTQNYAIQQRKVVTEQLRNCADEYKGDPIPPDILTNVCNTYNAIQRLNIVKRSDTKNDLLAAVLYYECRGTEYIKKKHEICEFMKLRKYGFSAGEKLLRNLCITGKLNGALIVSDENAATRNLITRYVKNLAFAEKYIEFVIEMIERSDEYNICISILLTTKITYYLWLVKCAVDSNITLNAFERIIDCRKSTFDKVGKICRAHKDVFADIMTKYNIKF